jgi:hypothetical protein
MFIEELILLFMIPMVLLVIGTGLFIFSFGIFGEDFNLFQKLTGFVTGLAIAYLLVTAGINTFTSAHTVTEEQHVSTNVLVSLADGSKITGSFSGGIFLSRGTINQNPVYNAYEKLENGSYRLVQYNANSTTIHYTNENYRGEGYATKVTMKTIKLFGIWEFVLSGGHTLSMRHELFVPEGSIVEDFNLDGNL